MILTSIATACTGLAGSLAGASGAAAAGPEIGWLDRLIGTRETPGITSAAGVFKSWNIVGCALGHGCRLGISSMLQGGRRKPCMLLFATAGRCRCGRTAARERSRAAAQSALMFLDLITPAQSASSAWTKAPSAAGSM